MNDNNNITLETITQSANDYTKTEINENTRVCHLSGNNFSYSYNVGDGRFFEKYDLNHDVILTEEDELGRKEYRIGYATNKKEFVDLVYNNLH